MLKQSVDMGNLRVSTLIAAFNVEKYIRECLESIDSQSSAPDEVIIINDGSSDNTLKLIEDWSKLTAIPATIISQENKGITKTRNRLLSLANYELIAFLDSDDYWEKHHIEKMRLAFHKHPNLVCVFSDASAFNKNGIAEKSYLSRSNLGCFRYEESGSLRLLQERITRSLIPGCFIHLNSAVFKKEDAENIGFFDEFLPLSEDRDFFIRLSINDGLAYYTDVHSFVRQHDSNSTGSKNRLSVLEKSVSVAKKIKNSKFILQTRLDHLEARRVLRRSLFNYRYTASTMGISSYIGAGALHDSWYKIVWILDIKSWLRASVASLRPTTKKGSC
ncbi:MULTISPECIES: glycosyltransferase [unclassified Marinobacter]|uniref:glycosyltransferase n=1 Tax=unclassified Marinobacter TaxID=83889 RepID=UPI00300B7E9E